MDEKKYNIQPIDDFTGDTRGKRKLEWFIDDVFSVIKKYIRGDVIDIGCGNGRLNPLILPLCTSLVCVDPVCELDSRFKKNAQFISSHLHELSNKVEQKFDTILFFGSYYIIANQYGAKTFEYCNAILNKDGTIIFMVDAKDDMLFDNVPDTYELVLHHITDNIPSSLRVYTRRSK